MHTEHVTSNIHIDTDTILGRTVLIVTCQTRADGRDTSNTCFGSVTQRCRPNTMYTQDVRLPRRKPTTMVLSTSRKAKWAGRAHCTVLLCDGKVSVNRFQRLAS